jgi:hypothetical protein
MKPSNPSQAGGAAMAGGQRFQAQVTAWWCARILLQTPSVGEPFGLPPVSLAERVYCETTDSVDDIRIELTGNGRIFGQCKRSLRLSSKPGSIWASVLTQLYNELEGVPPAEMERRLVLFYEEPNRSLTRLNAVLNRYRHLPHKVPLINAVQNAAERQIVNGLNALLDTLQAKSAFPNLAAKRQKLLQHIYIKQLHLAPGEVHYLGVADALRDSLLTNPAQTNQVLISLHSLADDLLAERGSVDRLALRRRLKGEEIILRDSPNYRPDFERLENWSTREIAFHEEEGRSKLTIAGNQVTVVRPVVQEILEATQKASFLVAGGAGTGKTGCLLSVAKQLRASGHRVWYWAADSLQYSSSEEIGNQLKLQYPWEDLFAEAASGIGARLIIDGLDGLRDTCAQRAYRRLVIVAIRCGIRVIASIRSFDLQYATDLQEMFALAGQPLSTHYSDGAFNKVSHIVVPELDNEEFGQVIAQFSSVQEVLDTVPQLRSAVRNLFSLNLLCKLIEDGHSARQLSAISTQAELFERYWAKRVTAHELHAEITRALESLVEQMIDQQTLQVIPSEWSSQVRDAIFSAGLVRHPPSPLGHLPEQERVEFNHHLLFDYAAERLFVRPRRDRLAVELASPDTWGLFLRPSLVLFHRYVWHHGRLDFWDTLIELERSLVPILQRLPGHLVVAEEAQNREDLQSLLDGCLRDDGDKPHWISIAQGVVAAATFSSLPQLFNQTSGDWWLEFARDLIQTGNGQLVYTGRRLLFPASDALENLSAQTRLFVNQAAVALIRFHWSEDTPPSHFIWPAIRLVCRTIGSDLSKSSEIIRRVLTPEELRRAGYVQAWEVARHISYIWRADPSLAVEVYDGVFGYVEADRSSTPFGGFILPMSSNRAQDYKMAYYGLSMHFPAFLSAHPKEATCTLIRVLRHYRNQQWHSWRESLPSLPVDVFVWDGYECRLQADYINIWSAEPDHADYQVKMLYDWEYYLAALPDDDEAEGKWETISTVLAADNELVTVWRRLLIIGSRSPAFYAQRLWTMLLNPPILIRLEGAAGACIAAFVLHLPHEAVRQIEHAVFSISKQLPSETDTKTAQRHTIRTQVWLLSHIPEERRGVDVKEFLASCDPELLQLRYRNPPEDSSVWGWEDDSAAGSQHQELLQVSAGLDELSANSITDDTLEEVLQKIHRVEKALAESRDEIDDVSLSTVQERLVRGLARVACSQAGLDERLTGELFKQFRETIASPAKSLSRQHLEQFDSTQLWSSLGPRAYATEGFTCLVVKIGRLTDDHRCLLRRAAADPDPIVQIHLGRRMWPLLEKWSEFVWETLESWITELSTRPDILGVLSETLCGSWFWWLRNNDSARADQLLRNLLGAARLRDAKMLRRACGMLLAALSFVKGEVWAGEVLIEAVGSIRNNLDELGGAQRVAIEHLLSRTPKASGPVEQRQRAREFLLQLLNAADQALEAYRMEILKLPASDCPGEPPGWVRQVAQFFGSVAAEFMFCAENYVQQWATVQNDERMEQMKVWWETVEPILNALLVMPHPQIAYHLIKGLEHFVDLDIQRVLYWMRRVTLASASQGLTTESLAADETIGILERILAESKASLAVGTELRSDFVQVLEAYLQVGWPKAMQLAIRLDSIFR